MSEEQLRAIADCADMVVNGYAFTSCDDGTVKILNLNAPLRALVLNSAGETLETSMDDIEIGIVRDYLSLNHEFLAV